MRILICDDQEMIREGLTLILGTQPDLEVIGSAEDGARAIEMIAQDAPDLLLLDLKMPVMDGIQAAQVVRRRFPQVKVLILTTYSDDEWLFEAIRSGVDGYLLKDAPSEDLFRAIRAAMHGETPVDPKMTRKLFDYVTQRTAGPEPRLARALTARESEILRLIAQGYSNAAIASTIHLSEGTVRNYITALLAKLEVSDRTQAALLAIRHGLAGE